MELGLLEEAALVQEEVLAEEVEVWAGWVVAGQVLVLVENAFVLTVELKSPTREELPVLKWPAQTVAQTWSESKFLSTRAKNAHL